MQKTMWGYKKNAMAFFKELYKNEKDQGGLYFLSSLSLILSELAFRQLFLRLPDVKPPCRTCRVFFGPAYFFLTCYETG